MLVQENVVIAIMVIPAERMENWQDYQKSLAANQLRMETVNTMFMLDNDGNVVVTMAGLARNEMLMYVKRAYRQGKHLLQVPVEISA